MVTHGAARGSKIGFPTANLAGDRYAVARRGRVRRCRPGTRGVRWPAAINVGTNPTFGEQALKLEVHLIDFSGTLYGQPLEVDFLGRLRDIHPFANVGTSFQAQLRRDV